MIAVIMGFQLLDMTFRSEKRFGVKLKERDFVRLTGISATHVPTVGDFHNWVCQSCREQGVPIPHGSWRRIKLIIVDVTGTPPSKIRKESLLNSEIGIG